MLKGISFTVGEAEIVTILATVPESRPLRSIGGSSQKRGHIKFHGQDISNLAAHQVLAKGLCLVPVASCF